MKNVELEYSVSTLSEEEIDQINGGGISTIGSWLSDNYTAIGDHIRGYLKNKPDLPSATVYK